MKQDQIDTEESNKSIENEMISADSPISRSHFFPV